MTTCPPRLAEELTAIAAAQAARAGVSRNQYVATVLAKHVGARVETGR
jgi:predicted HicB family RNase H-like nuclease